MTETSPPYTVIFERGDHFYIFRFLDRGDTVPRICKQLGRWAASHEIPLTWHEAALICNAIKSEIHDRESD